MPTDRSVAVVTGGNRGIGLELCRQLASNGYLVVLGSRDLEKGRRAAADVGQDVVVAQLDVSDDASVRSFTSWITDDLGRVDVLLNNAAILYDTWALAWSADLDVIKEAFETNLFGAWRTTQALLPLLRASPHARVVMVSSEAGAISEMTRGTPAYNISKASLNALTRLLAGELRRDGILVNAVCPGWVATDMGGPGGRPVSAGAASVMWAVQLPDDGPTGGFFRDGHQLPW